MFPESEKRTHITPKAWLIIFMNALYSVADSLCSVFVSVYLYVHSLDFNTVFIHYLMIYIVTPFAFTFAGWYAKSHDRTHVFRIGLALHAVYYAFLLYLREDAPQYAAHLGALLGVTWGFFWAGNNTFQYDFSNGMRNREYFLGMISTVNNGARLFAPLISGIIIAFAPTSHTGYRIIFSLALFIYLIASLLSFRIPHSQKGQPFHLKTALFPPKKHRDWRIILLASASLAGSFHIFHFLLAIIMYTQANSEVQVGGYASLQGLISIVSAYLVGRFVVPKTRSAFMFWGVVALSAAGFIIMWKITMATLIAFAFLRSVSLPLVGIPHTGIRFEVMQRTTSRPDERIEYLCAWEIPLAVGRILMMALLMALYAWIGEVGIQIALLILCLNRIFTYMLLRHISFVRNPSLS
ncbi:MAG: MFS transporter [Candidatus Hydrogenedentes bacterium]|nr:MFS transporter [Candidatus Hydrogenedentota bacterium]